MRPAPSSRRRALVAGAAGRLGEALLAQVVASPRYGAVTVLTEGPLTSTVRGLAGASLAQLLQAAAEQPQPDAGELDVFACWGDAEDPFGHAANRRDAVYASIIGTDALRSVAAAAAALHTRRLLVLAPLVAWQQISAASRMLPQALEMELARLSIPSVIILRPTAEQQSVAAGGTRMQRFVRFYLSQLRFMLPAASHSMRSDDIARAALAVMAESDAPGLHVVPLETIRRHAGRKQSRAAPTPPPSGV
jgi:hypothetical protein